ncbi:MAG: hypothetical protein KJ755_16225 [Alphaproteobacteria bacterium]|nr:hypothetical protein [Alphaproteobacteria bacterium]
MFKFFWRLREPEAEAARDWRHDPTGHPAVRAMNLKELADLPMVAEVPMRVAKAEVAACDCRLGVGQVRSAGCAVSR